MKPPNLQGKSKYEFHNHITKSKKYSSAIVSQVGYVRVLLGACYE